MLEMFLKEEVKVVDVDDKGVPVLFQSFIQSFVIHGQDPFLHFLLSEPLVQGEGLQILMDVIL